MHAARVDLYVRYWAEVTHGNRLDIKQAMTRTVPTTPKPLPLPLAMSVAPAQPTPSPLPNHPKKEPQPLKEEEPWKNGAEE